jgi:hypothetical protein
MKTLSEWKIRKREREGGEEKKTDRKLQNEHNKKKTKYHSANDCICLLIGFFLFRALLHARRGRREKLLKYE